MRFPLNKTARPSRDSLSFEGLDLSAECPLPLAPHPGAFAAQRTRHVHEGVDLYGFEGDPVFAIEDSRVVAIIEFTGPALGSSWWLPTQAVLAQGAQGVWVYGELAPAQGLEVGSMLKEGDSVGSLLRVLARDKGRPTCMLHVELREPGSSLRSEDWALGAPRPAGFLDPTPALARAAGWHELAQALESGDDPAADACLAARADRADARGAAPRSTASGGPGRR